LRFVENQGEGEISEGEGGRAKKNRIREERN